MDRASSSCRFGNKKSRRRQQDYKFTKHFRERGLVQRFDETLLGAIAKSNDFHRIVLLILALKTLIGPGNLQQKKAGSHLARCSEAPL